MQLTNSSERQYDSESFGCIANIFAKRRDSEFANSTILTIAHRLRTVVDYDRVSYVGMSRC